jgi:hypothetical protein
VSSTRLTSLPERNGEPDGDDGVTWVRLDDGMSDHPKIAALSNAALGAMVRALCYCARNLTDGFVPFKVLGRYSTAKERADLVTSGVLDEVAGGYQIHDYLDYQPSKAEVLAEREQARLRMELGRDPELRAFLRQRDGDRCRYCGCGVRWTDRRGPGGATYDHVDPEGGSGPENLVIACRGCNSRKGRRTPAQAGMVLHAPGYHLGLTQVVSRKDLSLFKTPVPDPAPDPVPDPEEDQKYTPPPPASGGRRSRRRPPPYSVPSGPEWDAHRQRTEAAKAARLAALKVAK